MRPDNCYTQEGWKIDMSKHWEEIRSAREDITDFVIHFTRNDFSSRGIHFAKDRLISILRDGAITPTFAPLGNRYNATPRPTIQGKTPVVCLTEQPLAAYIKSPHKKYSNYGIAFHKAVIHRFGGRPVLYATEEELRQLPDSLKYLWTRYHPILPHQNDYPVDFTWEREWRFKGQLNILLETNLSPKPHGIVIVAYKREIPEFQELLSEISKSRNRDEYAQLRIISIETAMHKIKEGDLRYCRLETWPAEA